nr:Gag-Pol polyprotein [Tanacetum cinerariifolium]
MPNNSQVKLKKTQVEVHLRIPSISIKMKSVTACNDSLNSRTLNANAVCATCKKCLVDSNHFACVTKILIPDEEETLALERESREKLNADSTCLMPLALKKQNDSFIFVHELKQEMHADLKYVESLEKEINELESDKAKFSNMYDMILQEFKECECLAQKLSKQIESVSKEVHTKLSRRFAKLEKHSIFLELALQKCKEQVKNDTVWNEQASNVFLKERVNHKTNVSRPQHRSNQMKDKVVPNNSQVKLKKTQVEDHPRITSISNKIKSVTTCNDSLNSRTSNANAVCATGEKCLVDSDHFACVTKMLNDVNARTKKPNVVPICTRKPKGHANKSVARPHKKKVASKSTTQKPKSYCRCCMRKLIIQLILFIVDSGCTKHTTGNLKLLCNFVKKHLVDAHVPSQQELDILFSPLYNEFFTAEEEHLQDDEFTNPFCTLTKDHPLEQVHGNPSKPVQTRRQLATDPEMCMFALTVSTAEPKNIKEVMANSALIEVMQEELHQFDRLQEEVYVAKTDGFVDPDHPEK